MNEEDSDVMTYFTQEGGWTTRLEAWMAGRNLHRISGIMVEVAGGMTKDFGS